MTTQPEAMRLADALEISSNHGMRREAAAELRRLQAENEALRKTLAASCNEERQQMWEAGPGGGCSRALTAEFQRDALLEALKYHQEQTRPIQKSIDAIAKAEGQQ